MDSDIGIIDQQTDRVGVISRRNLNTFNPEQGTAYLARKPRNTEVYGLIDQQNDRVGVITEKNLDTYNKPLRTQCTKQIMFQTFENISYDDKNRALFWENQKIQPNYN